VKQNMTEQEIIAAVNEVFQEDFEIERERLLPEMNIFEDLELDSLDIVDLVIVLETAFGIKIREEEGIRKIRTLGDIHAFVIQKKNELESNPR